MRAGGFDDIHRAAGGLDQEAPEHAAEDYSQPAEDDERQPPPVVLPDPAGEKATANRAEIHARLMQPHRSRTRVAAVIVADERHRRGEVEGLAQSLGGAPEEQVPERA